MGRAADPELARWWRELIERADASSLTIIEFCRRHEVSTASYYNWRRKFLEADQECRELGARREPERDGDGAFLPVNVSETEVRSEQCLTVRIALPQGARIDIPAAERALVLSVVAALAAPTAPAHRLSHTSEAWCDDSAAAEARS